ncbi:hypothetical protein VTK26DRAFT_5511 [Humicola hyalothermophila]
MAPKYKQNTFTIIPNPLGMQGLVARAAVSNVDGPRDRPMTTRQVQKAYRERTRQPRMSKAEQRRLEREEQERIRKELEKERQAARARTLRERKRAKEMEALQERKRKGLPLVEVRPSQDTISRFLRGNGTDKKRDAIGEKVALPPVEEEASQGSAVNAGCSGDGGDASSDEGTIARQPKRPRLSRRGSEEEPRAANGQVERETAEAANDGSQTSMRDFSSATTKKRNRGEMDDEKQDSKPDREQSSGSFDVSFDSVEAVIELIPEERNLQPGTPADRANPSVINNEVTNQAPDTPALQPKPPNHRTTSQDKGTPRQVPPQSSVPHPSQKTSIVEQTSTPMLRPAKTTSVPPQQTRRSPGAPPTKNPLACKPLQDITNRSHQAQPSPAVNGGSKFPSPFKPPVLARQSPRRSPAAPAFKQQRPATPAGGLQTPKFLPPQPRTITSRFIATNSASTEKHQPKAQQTETSRKAPMNTQSFIMAHIDDFPTGSQEAAEIQAGMPTAPEAEPPTATQLFLMANLDDILPSPSQEARELQAGVQKAPEEQPPSATQHFLMANIDDILPSPSQEARELQESSSTAAPKAPKASPVRPPIAGFAVPQASRPRHLIRQVAHVNMTMTPPRRPAVVKQTIEDPVFPFISTQDLEFSSQDIRELTSPIRVRVSKNNTKPPFPLDGRGAAQQHSPLPSHISARRAQGEAKNAAPNVQARQTPPPSKSSTPARTAPCTGQRKDDNPPAKQAPVAPSPWTPAPAGGAAGQSRAPGRAAEVAQPAPPPPPPSPQKRRFFTPSGLAAETALAVYRSRKTHEEEERRRRAEARERERQQEAERRRLGREGPARCPPAPRTSRGDERAGEASATTKTAGLGDGPVGEEQEAVVKTASQETDYGGDELDGITLSQLPFL